MLLQRIGIMIRLSYSDVISFRAPAPVRWIKPLIDMARVPTFRAAPRDEEQGLGSASGPGCIARRDAT